MLWFQFPSGVTQISVNLQVFKEEFSDESASYFRAPDHFAPAILDLPGFKYVPEPEGAPQLPEIVAPADDALALLTSEVSTLKEENGSLRALVAEADRKLGIALARIQELESKLVARDEAEEKIASIVVDASASKFSKK